MAPTADPTDAPVVSVTALTTPSSTVTTGQTVPVEDTSMYPHFLPHCVHSDCRYSFNQYLRYVIQYYIITIHCWAPSSESSLRSASGGRGGRGLWAGPVWQLPDGWILVEEKVIPVNKGIPVVVCVMFKGINTLGNSEE